MYNRDLVELRQATEADADAVARLHADSWRRHYRGSYSDAFLDGDVVSERIATWTRRLMPPRSGTVTLLAEERGLLVGFAHTILDDDARWGSLLDNLHVLHTEKRRGIGARLMSASAAAAMEQATSPAFHLWVLERNVAAQSFYAACGGAPADRKTSVSPAGDEVEAIRYVWPDARTLAVARS